MKKCRACKENKELSEFVKDKSRKSGCTNLCKKCARDKYRLKYPLENIRRRSRRFVTENGTRDYTAESLWARYELTKEDLKKKTASQQGKCKICEEEPTRLVIDHCHSTGKVRGLLCDRCNAFIGHLERCGLDISKYTAYLKEYE